MPSRRVRIAEGVYQDRYGLAATVKVGRQQREQRFSHDTSPDYLQAWRARTRAELLEDRDEAPDGPEPQRGTYADDLERYLKKIEGRIAFKADRSHLRAWLPALGPLLRHQIRPAQVQAAMDRWRHAGKSARTIRHRVRVLRELYTKLDGAHARPPLKGITLPSVPAAHPTAVPWATVRKVAASLKAGTPREQGGGIDSAKGYARFLVRATTGQRPAQIMRAVPEDVDLKRRLWFVRPAKGGTGIALPLNAEMVKAWKAFAKADAWGSFDVNSFSKLLRRHGWPKGTRPYNLRHTFAIDMIIGGADLGDVQAALGHRQIDTTRAHYASIQLARLRKALKLRTRKPL